MQRMIILIGLSIMTACGYKYSKDPIPEMPSIDQRFLDNSITYLDKMIQSDPDNLELYMQKLNIYQDQGWPTESITALNASIGLDSANFKLVEMRKDYYLKNGSYRRALLDIDFLINKGVEGREIGPGTCNYFEPIRSDK